MIAKKTMKDLAFPKERVDEIEREFLKHKQAPCPVIHRFGPGIYIREVFIPAGTMAIGHHQNFEHQNIFLKGRVTILNEDGTTSELKAPMMFIGKPGRKIGYIHEDMVWLNVYATHEKDVEKLEAKYLTKSDGWEKSVAARESVELLQGDVDVKDFFSALNEFGFTEEQARKVSENNDDMIELPLGGYKIKVGRSKIEGQGLFATSNIRKGELIAPARIEGKRTIAGRYANHSVSPNARMVQGKDNNIDLVAITNIEGCFGGLDGEEITVNYRDSLSLTQRIGLGGMKCQQ